LQVGWASQLTKPWQKLGHPKSLNLGLGAKYLPHHKGLEIASALDYKLKSRLQKKRQAGEDAGHDAQGGSQRRLQTAAARPHHADGKEQGVPGQPAVAESSDEDSDEEKGRASQFKGTANRSGPAHGAPHSNLRLHGCMETASAHARQGDGEDRPDHQNSDAFDSVQQRSAGVHMTAKQRQELLLLGHPGGASLLSGLSNHQKKKKSKKKKKTMAA